MYSFRNSSLTKDQLTSLGVNSKDNTTTIQTPLFPPLINSKPIEIEKNPSIEFKTVWKEDFRSRLFEIHNQETSTSGDSYSFKIAATIEKEHKKKLQIKFNYESMPKELLQNPGKRKSTSKVSSNNNSKRKKNLLNVNEKLDILEEKEKVLDNDEKSEKAENDSDEEIENNVNN